MKLAIIGLAAACLVAGPVCASDPVATMREMRAAKGGLIVTAHRGCHEAAPRHGWGPAPENSATGLARCADMGVDIMETDVRKSRDGYLVMIHDDQVDRTTDGKGKVSQLTLAQLKALHLRQNEGGADAPLTDQTILTLDEILALSKGRIVLNLDVKDAIYAEVIDAVCRANAQDRVIVKTSAGAASQPLAPMAPYDRVPFMIIPMSSDVAGSDIPGIIAKQTAGPRKPVAIELPLMPASALPAIAERAGTDHVALWVNTLWSGFVTGVGGDVDALRMPEAVWGRLNEAGVTVFQTDEPEALIAFRKRLRAVKSAAAPASS